MPALSSFASVVIPRYRTALRWPVNWWCGATITVCCYGCSRCGSVAASAGASTTLVRSRDSWRCGTLHVGLLVILESRTQCSLRIDNTKGTIYSCARNVAYTAGACNGGLSSCTSEYIVRSQWGPASFAGDLVGRAADCATLPTHRGAQGKQQNAVLGTRRVVQ